MTMSSRHQGKRWYDRLISALYAISLIIINAALMLYWNRMNSKLSCPRIAYILIFLLAAALLYLILEKRAGRIRLDPDRLVLILSGLLAVLLVYLCYSYYFLTGWDVELLLKAARLALSGQKFDSDILSYLSTYPNNRLLIYILEKCLWVNARIGFLDPENGIMVCITLNCLISAATGYLLYRICTQYFSRRTSFLGWLAYVALICFSPWNTIPYSDTLALLFPTLIFYLYTEIRQDSAHRYLYIALLCFLVPIGYAIKPQASIVFIAICLYSLLRLISRLARAVKTGNASHCLRRAAAALCIASLALIASVSACRYVSDSYERRGLAVYDSRMAFGPYHYLMMGMNPWTSGLFLRDDVLYSQSFPDVQSRTAAEKQVIRQRLQDYGAVGYAKLLRNKILLGFNDGTFSWFDEGDFVIAEAPAKNTAVSSFLKSFYWRDGSRYFIFNSLTQLLWAGVLFLCIFARSGRHGIPILKMTLLGVIAFELLFEVRGRYLYANVPIFILLSLLGARNLLHLSRRLLQAWRQDHPAFGADAAE